MLVTINTDASFKDGAAGFAFWIVCDQGKILKAGRFKEKVSTSQIAELMAIANAIYTLKKSKFSGVEKVIINTDSQTAINYLTGIAKNKRDKSSIIAGMRLVKSLSCKVEFRHVRAHTGKDDARSFVNEWCDKEAKKWMRVSYSQLIAKT